MINSNPSQRLIKHIIRSYARLADNTRVRSILRENLPMILKDKVFYQSLDESSKRWIQNLMKLLSTVEKTNYPQPISNQLNPNFIVPGTNSTTNQVDMMTMGGFGYNMYNENFIDGTNGNVNMNSMNQGNLNTLSMNSNLNPLNNKNNVGYNLSGGSNTGKSYQNNLNANFFPYNKK